MIDVEPGLVSILTGAEIPKQARNDIKDTCHPELVSGSLWLGPSLPKGGSAIRRDSE
jgi:hypothetical protein